MTNWCLVVKYTCRLVAVKYTCRFVSVKYTCRFVAVNYTCCLNEKFTVRAYFQWPLLRNLFCKLYIILTIDHCGDMDNTS